MNNRKNINRDTLLLGQPKDILRTIFSFFNQVDLSRAGATCKQLNELSKEEQFKSLPMPEFNFSEPLSSKTLPGQGASQVADYLQLMGARLTDAQIKQLSQHTSIRYLLPFSNGVICFGKFGVTYDYWCDSNKGYTSRVLYEEPLCGKISATALNQHAFVVGDESGEIIYFYRNESDCFNPVRLCDYESRSSGLTSIVRLTNTKFAVAYSDVIANFEIKNNAIILEQKLDMSSPSGIITAIAGTLDDLVLGYEDGKIEYFKKGCDLYKIRCQINTVKDIFQLTSDISCVVYASGIYVVNFKSHKILLSLLLSDNQCATGEKIRFVTPIAHGEWLICSELGKFTLQKLKFHKDKKLDVVPENDNAVSTPKLK